MPSHRPLLIVCLFTGVIGGLRAVETPILLVDAQWQVPLEYWQKDLALPLDGGMYVRAPTGVWLDGKALAFGRHDAVGADAVRSDRTSDVAMGWKAEVQAELAVGTHRLEPGGIIVQVREDGTASSASAAWRRTERGYRIACTPVQVDFVAVSSRGAAAKVAVRSAGLDVLAEQRLAIPAGGASLRLYLPVSDQPYELTSDWGEASFTVTAAGPVLRAGKPIDGVGLEVSGRTLSFIIPAKPSMPPAPAAASDGPELYLFIDRNREVYAEGERVQVSVRGNGLGAETPELIVEQDGVRLAAASPEALIDGGRLAAEWEFDTGRLRPGAYTLRVQAGGASSNALPLRLASAIPATNLKLFGFYKWGSDSYRPEDLAAASRTGLNLVMNAAGKVQGGEVQGPGNSPFLDWLAKRPLTGDPARLPELRGRPHFPPELAEAKNEHAAGAEYLLANGICNMPVVNGMILYFNVGRWWQDHADDRYQAVAQVGQAWRRFPNTIGAVHTGGDGTTPATMGQVWAAGAGSYDQAHTWRMDRLREAFEAKVGKLKVDDAATRAEFARINQGMVGALNYGVGMSTDLALSGDEAVKLEWLRWINDLYPECFRQERAVLARMIPGPLLTSAWTWGAGAGGGMWPTTYYQPLSHAVTDYHGDYGILPFAYITGTDLMTAGQGGKRAWVSLDFLPERPLANGLRMTLEAMSRNPAGIGALNTAGQTAGGWSQGKAENDRMQTVTAIGRAYGDLLMQLERRDEIAVLLSMRQAGLGGDNLNRLWGSHFLLSKAGFQANFITEEEVAARPEALQAYGGLMLAGMGLPLPAPVARAVAAFQAKGGVVIRDELTKAEVPDSIAVASMDVVGRNEVDFHPYFDQAEALAPALRTALQGRVKPFFTASTAHTHLYRSVDGDLEYWTLVHDGIPRKPDYANGHFAQFLYQGVESELTAGRTGVIWDALRRSPVETTLADGRLHWRADLRMLPGTFYLVADRAIDRLAVSATTTAPAGSIVTLTAQLLDPAGTAFTGRAAVEFTLSDPTGVERAHVWRTSNQEVALKIAGNDPAGAWTWRAVEQATGLTATGTLTVTAQAAPLAVRAISTVVCDAPAVHAAVHGRSFDIPLFPAQMALRPAADRLAQQLAAHGVQARVRLITPSQCRHLPQNWRDISIEDEEARAAIEGDGAIGLRIAGKNQEGDQRSDAMKFGFYSKWMGSAEWTCHRDVILLSQGDLADDGPLSGQIARARMLPRNPSPSFPAAGNGLLAYAWSPFHHGHDAIVVHGADDAGLAKAATALVELAATKDAPPAAPMPLLGRGAADGVLLRTMGLAAAGGTAATVTSAKRSAGTLLPPTFPRQVSEVAALAGRVALREEPLITRTAPWFADIDLAAGTARQFTAGSETQRGESLERLLDNLGRSAWLPPFVRPLAQDRIVPVAGGAARVDAHGRQLWFYDPAPSPTTYNEARYPRRLQRTVISADGKRLLLLFHDISVGATYGPSYHVSSPPLLALLDADTGKQITRIAGWMPTRLALAADGRRGVLVDDFCPDGIDMPWQRDAPNPQGKAVAGLGFDDAGKVRGGILAAGVDGFVASADGSLAAVSYKDPRQCITLIDLADGSTAQVTYPRADRGIAIAADGAVAVIAYADGLLRRVDRHGTILSEERMPAPGLPLVLADGTVGIAGDDGQLRFAGGTRPAIAFGEAAATALPAIMEPPVAGLLPPASDPLAGYGTRVQVLPQAVDLAGAVSGERAVTLAIPECGAPDAILLVFAYQMDDPSQPLMVTVAAPDGAQVYTFPASRSRAWAVVPFRGPEQQVAITVRAAAATLAQARLARLSIDHGLASLIQPGAAAKPRHTPAARIPNIRGALGDPRVDQVAFGWPGTWKGELPLDLQHSQITADPATWFDGDVRHGQPLYPGGQGSVPPWAPAGSRAIMRAAEVVTDFGKPITLEALAVWEHPGDLPVARFILESCDNAGPMTAKTELPGTWKPACIGVGNTAYYHYHRFAKPVKARYWRLSILDAPGLVQRLAEVELLGDAASIMDTPGGR